ncbi:MAG: hypothetical protein UT55_C0060G0004 [Candidatus Peregrinibacteria bacterium GW2011_GWE2_39_6]|nr:MAG: hypothetical protein UT36_C0002G0088 [Candidatus Peregrinibacteria bacterium GW2011_GWF2_39_17]KKR24542.1 MAG: hypothetical protein UT55_C0060G0004 [Candidatus Peregrinibacteria bacterium GW2011_GWE2_39_6]HCW32193.1 hypothetical protein [Candidatus Peregrinibacteria bacterium]
MTSATLIGSLAAIITTSSLFPQVVKTIKTKNTKSISLLMYSFFLIGVILWLIYGLLLHNWPIILANSVTVCTSLIILTLKIKHG